MNLLFFTQLFHPYIYGGGEYLLLLITKELVKRGHNVHVVVQKLQGSEPFEEFNGIKIHRVGTEIESHGMLSPSIRHNLAYLLASLRKGREIILQGKKNGNPIDIIHSNTYVPVISGHICSKLYGIPHVVTFHDVYQASDKKFWKDYTIKQNPDAAFYTSTISKILEDMIMKFNVKAFHTVSETSKMDLISCGVKKEKIHVIPNAIDSNHYNDSQLEMSVGENNHEPSIVFVGRLISYKNLETVIRAFQKVIQEVPNARLIIIGDGQYRSTLVKEASPLGKNVVFTGRISDPEKIKMIKSSSFMVFPSLVEGFGISIIEGFACKKAVLVSDLKPMSDIVTDGQTGYVIPSIDINKWADAITKLLIDKNKQKEMGENAYQEFLSNYEITKNVSRIESLYKDIRK